MIQSQRHFAENLQVRYADGQYEFRENGGQCGNFAIARPEMFTHDYFSILRALETPDGTMARPAEWTAVKHPFAFVVFGPTDTVPWTED